MIRVLIAAKSTPIREEIRRALANAADICLVGAAETYSAAAPLILLISTPAEIEALRNAPVEGGGRFRGHIIALVEPGEQHDLRYWLSLELNGYLLRQNMADELPDAIRAAACGGLYLSAEFSQNLLATHHPER